MLKIEKIEDLEAFRKLETCWDPLVRQSGNMDIPFMTFNWFSFWWKMFGRGGRMLILVFSQDGVPVAILPLMRKLELWRGLPVSTVMFMANYYSGRTGIIGRPEATKDLIAPALKYLRDGGFNMLYLNFLSEDSVAEQAFRELLPASGLGFRKMLGDVSPYIRIDSTWQDFLKTRSRNLREKVRRTENSFARSQKHSLTFVTAPEDVAAAMDRIVAISRRTWKFREGTAIANDRAKIEFYRQYGECAAKKGMLKIAMLEYEGKQIAFTYEIKYGNRDYFLKTGFDEGYARLSPGIFILSESIKEAFSTGCTEYDLLGQNEGYKMKFTDLVRTHYKYWVFNDTVYGRFLREWEFLAAATLRKLLKRMRSACADLIVKQQGT
ncbi:MAG: GNAT family N-acetyltransferase [Deltaproteobacteria bacterium]